MEEVSGGYILIDKPKGWTSFDVVKKLRYTSKQKKIGHAGTLDPLASGLLIICYGKYTKKIETIQTMTKEYTGAFTLGATTPSYDLETEINNRFQVDHITTEKLEEVRQNFVGEITQIPPHHSAVKIDGKRAYEYARKGEDVKMKPRVVNIGVFEIDASAFPTIHFKVECSKGTYIRSLAHDFGRALDSGAYLSELRRTKIGNFDVEDAHLPNMDRDYFYANSRHEI